MGARILPTIRRIDEVDGFHHKITFDFRLREVRLVFDDGEIEFFRFHKIEVAYFLDELFSRPDGRREFIRYRNEVIRDGESTDFLDKYLSEIEKYEPELLEQT